MANESSHDPEDWDNQFGDSHDDYCQCRMRVDALGLATKYADFTDARLRIEIDARRRSPRSLVNLHAADAAVREAVHRVAHLGEALR